MKRTEAYLFLLVLIFSGKIFSQDIHFSQYYFSPLSLNPANTGNYKGDYRFFGNYRSQWRDIDKAYNTQSVGADFNFFPSNRQFSGGVYVVNDKSGGNLLVNKLFISVAHHFKINGNKIHVGIQPGFVSKSINFNSNTFPNQLNWLKGGYDNGLPNNESFAIQTKNYFDLNFGASLSHKYKKVEPEFGVALFHLTQPNESFYNDQNKLIVRQAYNAMVTYSLQPKVNLKFHMLYGYTAKASDWVSGVNIEYILSRDAFFDNLVFAGLMWRSGIARNSDAGIFTMGMLYKNYTLGLSYDITFSSLKTAVNSKGGFELAFIYRAKSTRISKKVLPCERY